jgi:hypothetical protein
MLETEKKTLSKITREDVMTKGLCMSVQGWIFPFLFCKVIFSPVILLLFFILSSDRVEVIVAHRRRFFLGLVEARGLINLILNTHHSRRIF